MSKINNLLTELRTSGILLKVLDNQLQISTLRKNISPTTLQKIKENKAELIAFLINNNLQKAFTHIPKTADTSVYPLSSSQFRIWLTIRAEGNSVAYNMPGAVEFNGSLNFELFIASIERLFSRHEILRMLVKEELDGTVHQTIQDVEKLKFRPLYIDLRNNDDIEGQVRDRISKLSKYLFDLEQGPLFQIEILRVEEQKYVFLYNFHHLIGDAWSLNIFNRDLMLTYNSLKLKTSDELPNLRIQYKDYAIWQQDLLTSDHMKMAKAYWSEKLKAPLPYMNLPTERTRPSLKTYNGNSKTFHLSTNQIQAFREFCQFRRCSVFTGLVAVLNCILYRYTGVEDIIIGTPVAGRNHVDLKDMMGVFINSVPLRMKMSKHMPFDDLVDEVKQMIDESIENQIVPLEVLIDELKIKRDISRATLFDIFVSYHNSISPIAGIPESDFTFKQLSIPNTDTKFDITFKFTEYIDKIHLKIDFNADIYSENMINRLGRHYSGFLEQVAKFPQSLVDRVDYLDEKEKNEVFDFNATDFRLEKNQTIISKFLDQANKTPHKIALKFRESSYSYKHLDEITNRFADYLRVKHNIKPGRFVTIILPRSEWMIISIFSILKVGAVFVPLDSSHPKERNDFVKDDCGAMLSIDESTINEFLSNKNRYNQEVLMGRSEPTDPAYLIYTSGSTGKPKGALTSNLSILNYNTWFTKEFEIEETDSSVLLSSYVFSGVYTSIFGCLLNGGTLHVISDEVLADPLLLSDYICKEKISFLKLTPSYLHLLIAFGGILEKDLNYLRLFVIGGDRIKLNDVQEIFKRYQDKQIIYHYGSSETTMGALTYEITSQNLARFLELPKVGKPIYNCRVYILDEALNLVPKGVVGEIYVGGLGVSRGYINRPELNANSFIASPFNQKDILFKTGDLGKWLEDHTIQLIGRTDSQVKVRGYRVEINEIEGAILEFKNILDVKVIVRKNNLNDNEIYCYYVSSSPIGVSELRNFLKNRIPDYMIPSYFVRMEKFPVTINGKVDVTAFPSLSDTTIETGIVFKEPETNWEKTLLAIWKEILDVPKIGILDDFFDLGGHSIKLIKLANRIYQKFGIRLLLSDLFKNSTIESQSSLISSSKLSSYIEIPHAKKQTFYKASPAQKRLYFLQQFSPNSVAYNMPATIPLGSKANRRELENVLNELVLRHESLRTIFAQRNQDLYQKILSQVNICLAEFEVNSNQIVDFIKSFTKPFDLSQFPLFRAALLKVEGLGAILIFDMHHIICDGTSRQILIDDFVNLNNKVRLHKQKYQYKDFSEWYYQSIKSDYIKSQHRYWVDHLGRDLPNLNLPFANLRPSVFDFNGDSVFYSFDTDLSKRIKDFGKKNGSTLQITILCFLKTLLYKITDVDQLIIGSGISGRNHPNLDGIVGMFVNMLPIKTKMNRNVSFTEFYKNVKKVAVEAYSSQDIPFDDLVDILKVNRDPSRNPIFDIAVVTQNFDRAGFNIESKEVGAIEQKLKSQNSQLVSTTAKFDMTWFVNERDSQIVLGIEYYKSIFEKEVISNLIQQFASMVKFLLDRPESRISEIPLVIPIINENSIINMGKGPITHIKDDETVVNLFEQQVEKEPSKFAVIDERENMTYDGLNAIANCLTSFLYNKLKVKPETPIGILFEKNIYAITSIIGVLKAGCHYIPIDPGSPLDRIEALVEDANIEILITEYQFIDKANKIRWRNNCLRHLVCMGNSNEKQNITSISNQLMNSDLWNYIGESSTDKIANGGWINSFTGKLLSRAEMEEYSENVLIKLKPYLTNKSRVLEIGCSSGLTLQKVAPEVDIYIGTDMSSSILKNTAESLKLSGIKNVQLSCLSADQIDDLQETNFDIIILNSVIQCFDGFNYFERVLEKLFKKASNKCVIFLGDLMDEDLRRKMIADLIHFKSQDSTNQYRTKIDWESELFISKDYLNSISQSTAIIENIEYSTKYCTIQNELTKYRYDAIVRIDKKQFGNTPVIKSWYNYEDFDEQSENLNISGLSKNTLAYTIYTSGTSGVPKGVMVEHKSIVRLVKQQSYIEGSNQQVLLSTGPITFDASIFEIWNTLLNGGTLILSSKETLLDATKLKHTIKRYNAKIMWFTSAWFNQLVEEDPLLFQSLESIIVGGEQLSPWHINKLKSILPNLNIINGYGPTENTTFSLTYTIENELSNIPIGKPINNTEVFIVDENDQLCPIGVIGEICLGGDGLARGYLNDKSLTARCFRKNPFNKDKKLYYTGDYGKWGADGNVEFIGRHDNQVKKRGFRIELTEIERGILKCPGVKSAIAVSKKSNNETTLVGYYVGERSISVSELNTFIGRFLPTYMFLDHFIKLDKFVLTPNGKIDRTKLGNDNDYIGTEPSSAIRDEIDEKVIEIWSTILNRSAISLNDNFFEIGGHSLKVTRVISQVWKTFNIKIEVKDVFVNPTVRELSNLIRANLWLLRKSDDSNNNDVTIIEI